MVLKGKSAAPGAAAGRIFIFSEERYIPAEGLIASGEEKQHLDRYLKIKKQAMDELEKIRLSMEKTDPVKAPIFNAQKEIADDIIINDDIKSKILNDRWTADRAVYNVYENVLELLRKTQDPLIAERAADFADVRSLLLRLWRGDNKNLSEINEPVIIAAKEIMPSLIAGNKEKILAVITETGGITSHAAVIAKSYSIPAVFGIDCLLNTVKQDQSAAVDADSGIVICDPDENVLKEFKIKCEALRRDREDALKYKFGEGRTSCGVKIDIGLNIQSAGDEELDACEYTDSVGVFRTEFIYMGRNDLPDEN
ncbi:MAG: PEP-utilizing enzyme, partial [Treponema sp.]|nr:PEP-utilizing enzyme [Treponema sp.]